jgi:hypothetical protein
MELTQPVFWRDPRMPYVELRKVGDGRKVCYAPHSHTQWSIGAITEGTSTFIYRSDEYHVNTMSSAPAFTAHNGSGRK